MIKSERQFNRAMRKMIRRVIAGKRPLPENPTRDDLEVLAECVKRGYIFSATTNERGEMPRNQLGVPIVDYISEQTFLLPGLVFLHPDDTKVRANIALVISGLALLSTVLFELIRLRC